MPRFGGNGGGAVAVIGTEEGVWEGVGISGIGERPWLWEDGGVEKV